MKATVALPDLSPKCADCAALCCVVFAFDKSESFAFDKAAGEVCRNLQNDGRCRVFEKRQELGLSGCVTYNCYGAGQRVSQELFKGRSWRDDPSLMAPMEAALSVLRRIHEMLLLLQTARQLPLTEADKENLAKLERELAPEEGWTGSSLQSFPIDARSAEVAAFLQGLRHLVSG